MGLLKTISKQEFNTSVLQSDKVVLVDFWAEWCPPCRAMEPVLEKVAKNLDATVDIVKVNTEESAENQMLAGEYEVQSIPNMVVFRGGKPVDRIIGMTQGEILTDKLSKLSQ